MNDTQINFFSESDYHLENQPQHTEWIKEIIKSEKKVPGEINYIFCDDEYLLKVNLQYLNHDTLTDIISFDYNEGDTINGDIFISIERVKENSLKYNTDFNTELHRVMAHGLLHFCGYKDKTESDINTMRQKEKEKIDLFQE